MTGRRRRLLAVALSFAVQVLPLFNVHAGWLPLAVMWGSLVDPSHFTLAALATGLLLQGLAGLLIYWLLGRWRWWKALILAAMVPVFAVISNLLLLWVVPLLVLVGPDRAEESGELRALCAVPDTTLAQVRSGTDLAMERAGEAVVLLSEPPGRGLLTMPDCQVRRFALAGPGLTVHPVARGGQLLQTASDGGRQYWRPGLAAPRDLPIPEGTHSWDPILSDDGQHLAWTERRQLEGGEEGPSHEIVLRNLESGVQRRIGFSPTVGSSHSLIGASAALDRFTLSHDPNSVSRLDRSGAVTWGPTTIVAVASIRTDFRWIETGWVAWDGYREEGRSEIAWSHDGKQGGHRLPRGRGINSLAVDPGGRFIAVAQQSSYSIGDTPDAVYVIDLRDGREVYRRFHPRYSRPRLAFLGAGVLAISLAREGRAWTRVYALAE